MPPRLPFVLVVATWCIGFADAGWSIDQESCKSSMDFVRKGIKSAFELNKAAQSSLRVPHASALDPKVKDLVRWLFAPDAENDDDLDNAKTELDRVFGWIQGLNKEDNTDIPHVMIYCNVERFEQRKEDEGRWYDTKTEAVVETPDMDEEEKPHNPQEACKTPKIDFSDILHPKLEESTTFAFTLNAPKYKTITICPWFLDYASKNSLKSSYSFKTWRRSKLLRLLALDKRVTTNEFTKVDLMSLFDKTMLHELAHTIDNGAVVLDPDGYASYGWINCKEIAKTHDRFFNADSFALFGSCSKLMQDGYKILEDGNVQ